MKGYDSLFFKFIICQWYNCVSAVLLGSVIVEGHRVNIPTSVAPCNSAPFTDVLFTFNKIQADAFWRPASMFLERNI